MEVPVYEGNEKRGVLRAQERGLYTVFHAELQTDLLCRLVAQFECGELALGVPAPENGRMELRASIPSGRLPRGRLLRGCLRTGDAQWSRFPGGEIGRLRLPPGVVKDGVYRFPWRLGDELPCPELLCFYRYIQDGEGEFLEVKLDAHGNPRV